MYLFMLLCVLALALVVVAGCIVHDEASEASEKLVYASKQARQLPFSGDRAFGFLERLVEIGPRWPGSDGARKQQNYIVSKLQSWGVKIEYDRFSVKNVTAYGKQLGDIEMPQHQ